MVGRPTTTPLLAATALALLSLSSVEVASISFPGQGASRYTSATPAVAMLGLASASRDISRKLTRFKNFSQLGNSEPLAHNSSARRPGFCSQALQRASPTHATHRRVVSSLGFVNSGCDPALRTAPHRHLDFRKMATTTATSTAAAVQAVESLSLKPPKKHVEIFRKDYKPTIYDIESVFLDFDLHETATVVKAELLMHRKEGTAAADLVLHGDELDCRKVSVDGQELESRALTGYSVDEDGHLTIPQSLLPAAAGKQFKVNTEVVINPTANLQLSGLYKNSHLFTTQCESHGFRRITFFLDRPDVLCRFRVRVRADKELYPVLLSNGNKVDSGVDGAKHFAEFVDPFPKPSYLFALVAGNLKSISGTFRTMSGRDVLVEISSEPEDSGKLQWAYESVLKAMKWDEEAYGREYDLDEFHVVCTRAFNFGAMENKGLNIFNSSLLLADVNTTTDSEFVTIMSVVGHEYFHNWTGNRVTCRDWFQLTLKEGLTVFRETEFAGDMSSHLLSRITDVRNLITYQFTEDAGPMAHPIRPESYISMDNFYTTTVYDKGAEVIGMYKTLLGKEGFRKGMDLYFQRHDMKAVTCDDFRAAMADANNVDLTQFERWYFQAGTPEVEVVEALRDGTTFRLRLRQRTPPTPRQDTKLPFHIPIKIGLLGKSSKRDLKGTFVVELREQDQTFTFEGIDEDCVLSFNRGFSAPIKVKFNQSDEDLLFLMAHDTDGLNRWEASQRMRSKVILSNLGRESPISDSIFDSIKAVLASSYDNNEKALCIMLPDTQALVAELESYDPYELWSAMRRVRRSILDHCKAEFSQTYESLRADVDTLEKEDMARRYLRNTLLSYLVTAGDAGAVELALQHYRAARNMTDRYSAFVQLMNMDFAEKDAIVADFYERANGDALVIDKWFSAQAISDAPDCLERVKALSAHKDFTNTNPNRANSLVRAFTRSVRFHDPSGAGYKFLADQILAVDPINAHVSSHQAIHLTKFKKLDPSLRALMLGQLERLINAAGISKNLYEVVQKSLDYAKEQGFTK
ncbi:aminopeptidase n, putative [Babesia caballi]|uniref:Aminopeptidase n, putative n=1 Tax=Babesia caballi TaxID=5871 RepID=A0AAV4M2A5_BABCB|nr:aminopeptidase n, putative [Babesia caballi]